MLLYLGGVGALNILMELRTDCNIGRACLHDSQKKNDWNHLNNDKHRVREGQQEIYYGQVQSNICMRQKAIRRSVHRGREAGPFVFPVGQRTVWVWFKEALSHRECRILENMICDRKMWAWHWSDLGSSHIVPPTGYMALGKLLHLSSLWFL